MTAKFLRAAVAAALLLGCGPTDLILPRIGIGPAGGAFQFAGGAVTLSVPPNVVAAYTEFQVATVAPTPPHPLLVGGTAFSISPDFTFLEPIEITLSIPADGLPTGVRPDELRLCQLVNGSWVPVPDQVYESESRQISAAVGTTGTFALVGVSAGSVVVVPVGDTVAIGGTRQLVATVTSTEDTPLPARPVTWSTTNPAIATVANGLVSGVADGVTRVIARVESVADTAVIAVSSGIEPPQMASPDRFTNFSSYPDSASLWNDNTFWAPGENLVTVPGYSQITLDTSTGFGASDRSMRYRWSDRTSHGGRCSDIYMTRWVPYGAVVSEVWEEYVVKFSPNFTTKAPGGWACASNADYKFLLNYTGDASPPQRFDLKHDVYGTGTTWDAGVPGGSDGNAPYIFNHSVLHDGQWHRIRRHMRCNSGSNDGLHVVIIDADTVKVLSGSAIPSTCAQGGISALIVGANLNQGPDRQMDLHFGQISIWLSNPGPGFK